MFLFHLFRFQALFLIELKKKSHLHVPFIQIAAFGFIQIQKVEHPS